MLDDFFSRALIAGVGVALVAGPLGCYIVWRRLAYFGDTLSHAALLGVALALLFQVNITLSVFLVSVFASLALVLLQRRITLSADALLGLLAHSALAVGMVALSFMTWVRVDLMGFLFGDILAVTPLLRGRDSEAKVIEHHQLSFISLEKLFGNYQLLQFIRSFTNAHQHRIAVKAFNFVFCRITIPAKNTHCFL